MSGRMDAQWERQIRQVHDGAGWASRHRLVASDKGFGFFAPEDLFEVFLVVREEPRGASNVGAIYFNHEVEENVFHRQGNVPTPVAHMPARADATFAGHRERIKALLGGARYCLRVTEPQAYSATIFERLVARFAPLAPVLEKESRAIRTTAFVGDYAYTPFGVHVDPYPQVQCAISGARTAFFWEDAYWVGKSEADRMAPWKHLEAAHEVAVPAHHAIYWAGDYEHAFSSRAEGGEQPSIALTVSFPEIPQADSEIERMRRRSSHHFLNAPLARPARSFTDADADADQTFVGSALFPLALRMGETEAVVIGAGRTFTMPSTPAVATFIARVNERRPFRLRDCTELDAGDARAIVELLYAHYGVDAVEAR